MSKNKILITAINIKEKRTGTVNRCLKKFLLPIVLLLLWQIITMTKLSNPILLPVPLDVASTAWTMLKNGELENHLFVSIVRVSKGFLLAAVLAISTGIILGLSKKLYDFTSIIFQIIRPIPPIAWIPLSILWFGIEENSKIFIIVIGAFFPIFTNVLSGIWNIDAKLVEMAKAFCLSKEQFIRKIAIPSSLPFIMTGLRVGLGQAWMCVVAAELSAGMIGIGYMLTDARAMMQTSRILVGMISVGIVGKIMDSILLYVERNIQKGGKSNG